MLSPSKKNLDGHAFDVGRQVGCQIELKFIRNAQNGFHGRRQNRVAVFVEIAGPIVRYGILTEGELLVDILKKVIHSDVYFPDFIGN